MALTKSEVTVIECDGCGKREIAHDAEGIDAILDGWYSGTVHHGENSLPWVACSPPHVRKAIFNVIDDWMMSNA